MKPRSALHMAPSKTPAVSKTTDSDKLRSLYETMLLIRRSEERLSRMFTDGEIPGFIHLSIGQEAVSAGVMSALTNADTIASTHRGHGHALAKGMPLNGFFAELLARSSGLCRGRGGSMHVADLSIGMLGANGIVGAGLAIALGSALSHQVQKRPAVSVAFFGDGALGEGLLHETLNLAKLWKLPMLFACENNGWSEFQPSTEQLAFGLAGLASAYGIPHVNVDGNDVQAVAAAATKIVEDVRAGKGPAVLECQTTRVHGHFEGDSQKYRDADEIAGLPARDPIRRAAEALKAMGASDAELSQIADKIDQRIESAVAAARESPHPDFAEAVADVYTNEARIHG